MNKVTWRLRVRKKARNVASGSTLGDEVSAILVHCCNATKSEYSAKESGVKGRLAQSAVFWERNL